ncbi:MAG: hypothetical protein H6Q00_409 [Holophagaceae bacterium]|nr:hypothetical protein [Holophagaceae bacterium]
MPFVSLVHKCLGGHLAGEPFYLVKLTFQGVAVVGILRAGLDANHEAFLVGDRQTHLRPELVGPMRLPLRNTLHLGGMQAVGLVPGLPLLGQDQLGERQRSLVSLKGLIKRLAYGFRDNAYFFLKIRAAFPGIP